MVLSDVNLSLSDLNGGDGGGNRMIIDVPTVIHGVLPFCAFLIIASQIFPYLLLMVDDGSDGMVLSDVNLCLGDLNGGDGGGNRMVGHD
ncbi:hypothetical protein PRIPAC_78016 [Pristionchus pacificus]|uniref:Uncharacterized protein n=1 Tax=Pristionchus pacificus TaxID=54126 RepID=A0A2A6CPG7_PRIPA|nr:hypothetical protein PRIPAC_78016 [Pristionchus pacificus]|eukprot:PDM79998.1 hypothetical protein PRIPAC_32577 [Pristionchus pacificus]